VSIGKIPVMVGSDWCYLAGASRQTKVANGECEFDEGGYFIVKGTEKVVVAQEKQASNYTFVFKTKDQHEPWLAEIRSLPSSTAAFPILFRVYVKIEKGSPRILCHIRNITKDLPLGLVLRALGLNNDQEIF
jgi:DNA-directed RNA polymerase II subunit RPB2